MSVGGQISSVTVNGMLTTLAVGMRNLLTSVQQQYLFITASGGVTFLESIGYDSADAATVMTLFGYMNGIAAVYFGSGVQSAESDFDSALAVLWSGQ